MLGVRTLGVKYISRNSIFQQMYLNLNASILLSTNLCVCLCKKKKEIYIRYINLPKGD